MTLNDVKAGDTVLRVSYGRWSEQVVSRVTKTQIVLGDKPNESKFRKSDGFRVGSTRWGTHINAVDAVELEKFRAKKAEADELQKYRSEVQNVMGKLPRYQYMTVDQCKALIEVANKIMDGDK